LILKTESGVALRVVPGGVIALSVGRAGRTRDALVVFHPLILVADDVVARRAVAGGAVAGVVGTALRTGDALIVLNILIFAADCGLTHSYC